MHDTNPFLTFTFHVFRTVSIWKEMWNILQQFYTDIFTKIAQQKIDQVFDLQNVIRNWCER